MGWLSWVRPLSRPPPFGTDLAAVASHALLSNQRALGAWPFDAVKCERGSARPNPRQAARFTRSGNHKCGFDFVLWGPEEPTRLRHGTTSSPTHLRSAHPLANES